MSRFSIIKLSVLPKLIIDLMQYKSKSESISTDSKIYMERQKT